MAGRRKHKSRLSDEDRALWEKVVENTDPLRRAVPVFMNVTQAPIKVVHMQTHKIKLFHLGEKVRKPATTTHLQPDFGMLFPAVTPNMDKRNFDRLKKGKLAVDGKIDLHGMTLAEAHPNLNAFVRDGHARGKRLLLVITGKGKPSSDFGAISQRHGVLRHQVPQWLSMAPLAPLVLQVTQATRRHGGDGAYYVYLRRRR